MNAGDGGARQEKQLRQPHWASLMSVKESVVNFVVSGKDSKDFDRGGRNMCPCVLDR